MPLLQPERRDIYLTTRALIVEGKTLGKSHAEISRFFSTNKTQFADILKHRDEVPVVNLIHTLATEGVFKSEAKAKRRFPELFTFSSQQPQQLLQPQQLQQPQQPPRQSGSQQLAKKSRADTVSKLTSKTESSEPVAAPGTPSTEYTTSQLQTNISALPYVNLTPKSQHCLLVILQAILEECCFHFANAWIPQIMNPYNLTYAQAVELNRWSIILSTHFAAIPKEAMNVESPAALKLALDGVACIRHAAVHRVLTDTGELLHMLQKALDVTNIFKDWTRDSQLRQLRWHVANTVNQLTWTAIGREDKLTAALNMINAQRKALDQQERELRSRTSQQGDEDADKACEEFMQAVMGVKSVDEEMR